MHCGKCIEQGNGFWGNWILSLQAKLLVSALRMLTAQLIKASNRSPSCVTSHEKTSTWSMQPCDQQVYRKQLTILRETPPVVERLDAFLIVYRTPIHQYRLHKNPTLGPTWEQHTTSPYFFKTHFNIILFSTPTLPNDSSHEVFQPKFCSQFPYLLYVLYGHPIQYSPTCFHSNRTVNSTYYGALHFAFFF